MHIAGQVVRWTRGQWLVDTLRRYNISLSICPTFHATKPQTYILKNDSEIITNIGIKNYMSVLSIHRYT